ncbi:hypothetical protein CF326_g9029 [Tilletia indica]|nr:hypothetical protein CF326_g9029 [Tilletia indica]
MADNSFLPRYGADKPLVKALHEVGIFPRSRSQPPPANPYTGFTPTVSYVELGSTNFSAPISVYGADRAGQQQQGRSKPYDRPPTPQGPASRTRAAAAAFPPA